MCVCYIHRCFFTFRYNSDEMTCIRNNHLCNRHTLTMHLNSNCEFKYISKPFCLFIAFSICSFVLCVLLFFFRFSFALYMLCLILSSLTDDVKRRKHTANTLEKIFKISTFSHEPELVCAFNVHVSCIYARMHFLCFGESHLLDE